MSGRFAVEAVFRGKDHLSRVVGKIQTQFDRFERSATGNLRSVDKAFRRIDGGLRQSAKIVVGATVAAGAGLAALVKPALDVEEALAKVGTVVTPAMGTVQDALAETQAAALAWSKQHVATAQEFLEANYNMASAGLDSAQAIAGTRAALTLATATLGDAATAGNLLATVYNNMGNKAANADAEMTRLADVLAKTQALFQIKDLAQLNESLKMGAPAAIQYGVSIEQLSTALGALNTAGLQGSMAGTAFSASMRQMSKASKALGFSIAKTASGGVDYVATLQNIERKFGGFDKMTQRQKDAFQKTFGDEGLRAISLMLGKTDELAKSLGKVADSTGAAAAQEKIIEAARSNGLRILGNRIAAVAIEAGGALLPVLDELAPQIEAVVKSAGRWVEANKGLITSEVIGFVKGVRNNLPAIVTWLERIGKGVAAFYAMQAAVKAAQLALATYRGIVVTATIAKAAYLLVTKQTAKSEVGFGAALKGNATAAQLAAAANAELALAMEGLSGATAATGGKLAGLRTALNSTALAQSVNGVTSTMGKAGLLGAALAVGYAIGTWIDEATGFSDWAAQKMNAMFGGEDALNAAGGRATHRGFQPGDEGVKPDGSTFTPQVVGPEERIARQLTEAKTTNTEKVEVQIKAPPGQVEVKRGKKPAKGASITLKPSGAF